MRDESYWKEWREERIAIRISGGVDEQEAVRAVGVEAALARLQERSEEIQRAKKGPAVVDQMEMFPSAWGGGV